MSFRPAPGGGYASLTGPGQFAGTGDLTQSGGFFADDTAGTGITLASTDTSPGIILAKSPIDGVTQLVFQVDNPVPGINLTSPDNVLVLSDGNLNLEGTTELGLTSFANMILSSGGTISMSTGGDASVIVGGVGISGTDKVGFYDNPGIRQPTITGSRGGATVAVLASLLAALDGQGLIVDQTTA